MSEYLAIKNWDKYQHYKDRNPPWIKLHRELLTSATWATADDASRVLAIALMMLAAITGNKIPADKAYIKRVAYLNAEPDWSLLIALDFIEIIEDKKRCKRVASKVAQVARPETETEGETEKEESKKKPSSRSASTETIFDKAYSQYPRHIGKRAAEKAWSSALGRSETPPVEQAEFIYQRVMTYAAVCERTHKPREYIPHMATWLNQDRFMDDTTEWAVQNGNNSNGFKSKAQERHERNNEKYKRVFDALSANAGANLSLGDGSDGTSVIRGLIEQLPAVGGNGCGPGIDAAPGGRVDRIAKTSRLPENFERAPGKAGG